MGFRGAVLVHAGRAYMSYLRPHCVDVVCLYQELPFLQVPSTDWALFFFFLSQVMVHMQLCSGCSWFFLPCCCWQGVFFSCFPKQDNSQACIPGVKKFLVSIQSQGRQIVKFMTGITSVMGFWQQDHFLFLEIVFPSL